MTNISTELIDFTPEDFRRFADLLLEKCGMYFDESKFMVLKSAIKERLKATGISGVDSYYSLLSDANIDALPPLFENSIEGRRPGSGTLRGPSEKELRRLIEILAVNETQFFRNKEHFRALREDVIPGLIKKHRQDRQLRIWSAGCSTGQEPYSLAITVLEALEEAGEKADGPLGWKIQIVASDISERALRIANTARYRREELKGIEERIVKQYFLSPTSPHMATAPLDPSQVISPGRAPIARSLDRTTFQVAPAVKDLVHFYYFNLATPTFPPDRFSNFDLILCENVTIYFSPAVTHRVIENLYKAMLEGGYLFIGYSETLWQISTSFRLVSSHETFYYQKPTHGELSRATASGKPLTGNLKPVTPAVFGKEGEATRPKNPPTTPPGGSLHTHYLKFPALNKAAEKKVIPVNPEAPSNPSRFKIQEPESTARTEKEAGRNSNRVENNGRIPPANSGSNQQNKPGADKSWQDFLQEGLQLVKEHEFDAATSRLKQALSLAPNEPKVLVAVAHLKTKLGEYTEAAEFSKRAITGDPLCEEAHLILALIHHREGNLEESIAEFQKTIYINIDSVIAHLRLADIYRGMGQNSAALREYKSTLNALEKHRPDEIIEDLPVELLKRTCEQNILRLRAIPHR